MAPGEFITTSVKGEEMKVVLVPVDGSECSLRAVHYLIAAHAEGLRPRLHLLNVQSAMRGDVSQFVAPGEIKGYQHEKSEDSLRPASQPAGRSRDPVRSALRTSVPWPNASFSVPSRSTVTTSSWERMVAARWQIFWWGRPHSGCCIRRAFPSC